MLRPPFPFLRRWTALFAVEHHKFGAKEWLSVPMTRLTGMQIPKQVSIWAEQHAGLITRERALAFGMSPDQIDRCVMHGILFAVHPGIYRMAGAPQDHYQQLAAACLAVDGLVAVSHRAAGEDWDMDGVPRGHIEVATTRAFSARLKGVTVHWSTDLARHHCVVRNGLLVTNPPRTLVDLGAVCPQWIVELAADSCAARKLAGYASMATMLKEVSRRGRRGAGVLRAVLDARGILDPAGHLSAAVNRMFREYDVVGLVPEYEIYDANGNFLGRADYADPVVKFALEFDDWQTHSIPADVAYDHERQANIEDAGWTVRRWTSLDVRNRPWHVVAAINRIRSRLASELVMIDRE